jgi:hypothetical protein
MQSKLIDDQMADLHFSDQSDNPIMAQCLNTIRNLLMSYHEANQAAGAEKVAAWRFGALVYGQEHWPGFQVHTMPC